MRAGLLSLGILASCYAPHAASGIPCSADQHCPERQSCVVVAGTPTCIEGSIDDANRADAVAVATDARADAARLADAAPDAPPDAPIVIPRWSLVQSKASDTGAIAIASSGANHLILVAVETTDSGAVTAVTDDASNTYVAVPNGRAVLASFGTGLDLWYAVGVHPGAKDIQVTAPTVYSAVVWEVAGISTTSPLDTATTLDDQATSTLPAGAPITTQRTGEFVASVAIMANQASGIHTGSSFTNDQLAKGNGWAHLTDAAAAAGTYRARWDQATSGEYCSATAAFFVGP